MPRPHGVNTRIFSTRSRAVVLEAEWMVMTQRISNELKPLVKLAKDQGWTIESAQNGSKLVWRGPKGEGPVFTGYRTTGRDMMNHRAELVRAGLKLDEEQAKQHTNEVEVTRMINEAEANPMTTDELTALLDKVMSQLATLNAKAALFEKARHDLSEWEQIAQEAQDAAEVALQKLSETNTMLDAIRQCFSLAPWAILPEIARLLGIDSTGPGVRIPPKERTNA